jgi:hypothetical protein
MFEKPIPTSVSTRIRAIWTGAWSGSRMSGSTVGSSGFPSFARRSKAVQYASAPSALPDACADSERLSLIALITD